MRSRRLARWRSEAVGLHHAIMNAIKQHRAYEVSAIYISPSTIRRSVIPARVQATARVKRDTLDTAKRQANKQGWPCKRCATSCNIRTAACELHRGVCDTPKQHPTRYVAIRKAELTFLWWSRCQAIPRAGTGLRSASGRDTHGETDKRQCQESMTMSFDACLHTKCT